MRKNILFVAILALFVAGCSLSPKLEVPELEGFDSNNSMLVDKEWWREFGDSTLDSLIDEAMANNYDLLLAAASVNEAKAMLGLAKAQQFPSVGVGAQASSTKTPKDSQTKGATVDSYSAAGSVSYELDLWGKFRDSKRAALSQLLAMEATKDTIRLSISAAVAESYFTLLVVQKNLDEVSTMLENKEDALSLREKQYAKGAINELQYRQVEADFLSTKAQKEQLTQSRNSAATALAILVGRSPSEVVDASFELANNLPTITDQDAIEITSDLVNRRPDIKSSEEGLKAANYNIGAARAAYFPTISLTGSTGFQSSELGDLMKSGSATTQLSGGVSMPIFDFGRIGANVDRSKAAKERAIISYRQTLQKAFGEVYNAINQKEFAMKRSESIADQANALRRVWELTKRKYEIGYSNLIDVVDAETAYLSAKMNENNTLLESLTATVNLYKALGGGWENPKN